MYIFIVDNLVKIVYIVIITKENIMNRVVTIMAMPKFVDTAMNSANYFDIIGHGLTDRGSLAGKFYGEEKVSFHFSSEELASKFRARIKSVNVND